MTEQAKQINYDRLYQVYRLLLEAAAGEAGNHDPAAADTETDKARRVHYRATGRKAQAGGGE